MTSSEESKIEKIVLRRIDFAPYLLNSVQMTSIPTHTTPAKTNDRTSLTNCMKISVSTLSSTVTTTTTTTSPIQVIASGVDKDEIFVLQHPLSSTANEITFQNLTVSNGNNENENSSLSSNITSNGVSLSEWLDQTISSPSNPSENSVEGTTITTTAAIEASSNKRRRPCSLTGNNSNNQNSINNGNNVLSKIKKYNDEEDSEQELPSLSWLTQLAVTMLPNNPPIFDDDDSPNGVNNATNNGANNGNKSSSNQNSSGNNAQRKEDTLAERYKKFLEQVKISQCKYYKEEEYYLNNGVDKPIFNYATIIAMAMLENGKMTLQEICSWIEQKFKYYRGKKKWNNSIRHNLSLQYCFRKINRDKFEKGKGGYWELGMDVSKSERKRIRNKKITVANQNNNNNNQNRNNNEIRSSSLSTASTSSSSSSLSPLLCSSSEEQQQRHQHNFNLDLNECPMNDDDFTTPATTDDHDHHLHDQNQNQAPSLESIILDVLECDDLSSPYHHHHHHHQNGSLNEQQQQQQLDCNMNHETVSSVSNFLNHDAGEEEYCLVNGTNLDVLEQTLQDIGQNNVAAVFNSNNGEILEGHHIIDTNGTITTANNPDTYITLEASNHHQQQQQIANEITAIDCNEIGNVPTTIDIPTTSIVQISTADGCYNQIVEITNNDNFLNVSDLNGITMSSSNSSVATAMTTTATTTTAATAGSTGSSTSDMFDEDLNAAGNTMVDPTTMEAQNHNHHIHYLSPKNGFQMTQSCKDIVASVLNNFPCNGPSVVVEPIPLYNNNNDNKDIDTNHDSGQNVIRIISSEPLEQSESMAIDIFNKISSITPITGAITATTATIAAAPTLSSSSLSAINFIVNDDDDEEFNFFKYADDVDRRGDVDLFPFDGISAHEF